MDELVAGLDVGGCFATAAAAGAAAVAGSDLLIVGLCVLLSSFGLYPCGLVGAAVFGATSIVVQRGVFVVVVVQIAWNTTNALYEFFVVFLFLVLSLGLILGPAGCRFCLVGVIVLLFGIGGLGWGCCCYQR